MKPFALSVSLLALGCARAPSAPERPPDVPLRAVLVPSGKGASSSPYVWVSCVAMPEAARKFSCAIYPLSGGTPSVKGTFSLAVNHMPTPGQSVPTPPTTLSFVRFDGFLLHIQEPWVLVSPLLQPSFRSDPPIRTDPPFVPLAPPRPTPRAA